MLEYSLIIINQQKGFSSALFLIRHKRTWIISRFDIKHLPYGSWTIEFYKDISVYLNFGMSS